MITPMILAGGKGTRMQAAVPKPLVQVRGAAMIDHVLKRLASVDRLSRPVIVVSEYTQAIKQHCGAEYSYAMQKEVNGTATAAQAGLEVVSDADEAVLILYADHPFISAESLRAITEAFVTKKPTIALFTVTVPDFEQWRAPFASFGRIMRDESGSIAGIVENKNATPEQQAVRELNPGIYCVNRAWLTEALPQIEQNEVTGEYYLTDIIALARAQNKAIQGVPLPPREALGINSAADAEAVAGL